jgi:adenine-specific DNA-methyltransferase
MANIHETIANVEKLDPELARQIRKFVRDHSYGLVFEHNLPEAVRLYTKTPTVGDTVNIRPARGKDETAENLKPWLVRAINGEKATVENQGQTKTLPLSELVTVVSYRDTIYPGLKVIDQIERGTPDDPYQVVINAENYHALEMLAYCYAGKVDCIYIDPPYNSGAKDWKYNNNYVDINDKYRHSKWLTFMERRLKLAKQLLNPQDSVLMVTIDEKEYARLGLLLEQIFP